MPLLALLAMASALGAAVAIALAGVAMLLAAPAYAGEGSLLLERRGVMAAAERLSFMPPAAEPRHAVLTRREGVALIEPTAEIGPAKRWWSSSNTAREACGACSPYVKCCLPS